MLSPVEARGFIARFLTHFGRLCFRPLDRYVSSWRQGPAMASRGVVAHLGMAFFFSSEIWI